MISRRTRDDHLRCFSLSFNLVIEVLLISSILGIWQMKIISCFNLVIEVLLISRRRATRGMRSIKNKFQSRNRGSFDFKPFVSFHAYSYWIGQGFNLVIEVLLISRFEGHTHTSIAKVLFQSRNRGSFDFKLLETVNHKIRINDCFNLVIEVLLISSFGRWKQRTHRSVRSFNLVIEVLLISRAVFTSAPTRAS